MEIKTEMKPHDESNYRYLLCRSRFQLIRASVICVGRHVRTALLSIYGFVFIRQRKGGGRSISLNAAHDEGLVATQMPKIILIARKKISITEVVAFATETTRKDHKTA